MIKRLNAFNKVLAVIALLISLAALIRFIIYHASPRYYYGISVSYPRSFPINIRECQVIMEDGNERTVSTKGVSDRNATWGYGDSPDIRHTDPLPVRLIVRYASFADRSFYRDTINLPLDTLKAAFKRLDALGKPSSGYGLPGGYKRLDLVIGIANKGNIIVWLQGEDYEKVLLKHQIQPSEPALEDLYYRKPLSRNEYFSEVFSTDSIIREEPGFEKNDGANYIDTPSRYLQYK